MQVVRGAIQRIDEPLIVVACMLTALLGKDGVVGIGAVDHLNDRGFGGMIDLRHIVVGLFFADGQCVDAVVIPHQDAAGLPGGTYGDVGCGIHGARGYGKSGRWASIAGFLQGVGMGSAGVLLNRAQGGLGDDCQVQVE